MSATQSVLVTGGAGFIGSHLTEALLDTGRDVVVLDNLDPYYSPEIKQRNLRRCRDASSDSFTHVNGSVDDADTIRQLFRTHRFEYVFHEASLAGVRSSVESPKQYERTNVGGLLTLLEAARRHGVTRFVNASSSSVYGRPVYLPYDERHPTRPKSPYGVSKLTGEHYCKCYAELHDVPTVSLRYFTVYGPRMRPGMAISNFVTRCVGGDRPVIYGDGDQTRDFTYIDDVVDANLTLLETDAGDGEVMNIGSTDRISITELAQHVIDCTDASVSPAYEPAKQADARHTHADVSKAENLIGYNPTTTIRDGVQRFVDWYVNRREWYDAVVTA